MPTFEAIGVKASFSGDDNANNTALIQFRPSGATTWQNAYTPLIDHRSTLAGVANPYANQARVSIVGLMPNTAYDVQITWTDPDGVGAQSPVTTISTLSYTPPTGGSIITVSDNSTLASALNTVQPGQTIHLNAGNYAPFSVTRSGNAAGWIKIEGPSTGSPAIVSGAGVTQNVKIDANYVILQYMTLSASDFHGVYVGANHNHIFVQNLNLQNVSALCASGPTTTHLEDAGIGVNNGADNVFLLNNQINSTSLAACVQPTPYNGPGEGISFCSATTLVVQGNSVRGQFRDGITSDNSGCATENIDIVRNVLQDYVDDGPEIKGYNINARIWSNVVTANGADSCIAGNTNAPSLVYGPIYIFRNTCRVTTSNPGGQTVFKVGGAPTYIFHNSVDASATPTGINFDGYVAASASPIIALNNVVKTKGSAIDYAPSSSVFDYNIHATPGSMVYNWNQAGIGYVTLADFQSGAGQEMHGLNKDPLFSDTQLHVSSTSPAVNSGVVLANFNDATSAWPFVGAAPDRGAFEQ